MKRVNLVDYFDLAETLHRAHRATTPDSSKAGSIYFGIMPLPGKLRNFVDEDNGFSTCKHVASELAAIAEDWINKYALDGASPPSIDMDKFDVELNNWQYSVIASKITVFKSVFSAECHDVDVYSVGQISIYKTSALVANGANFIPAETQVLIPNEALDEFNNAGKCLAFDLPTACGFHALRGLELVMSNYLESFGIKPESMKSWNDHIKAAEKLIKDDTAKTKPSAKVAAMLDRLRELERNPLMHPRDTLDTVSADMLFRLCSITVIELARDKAQKENAEPESRQIAYGLRRKQISTNVKADAGNAA
ncbi:MAG: hypothetical protein R3D32_11285 [Nitratireductor sp.]